MTFGGIEAGGTKWVCAVGTNPDDISDIQTFPTSAPAVMLDEVIRYFRGKDVEAIGLATFGPISRSEGRITTTPKPGWANIDVVTPLIESLRVPVGFDTDVNAAALGEACWGASRYDDVSCYITVGTGIGGGIIAGNRVIRGLMHAEIGHMRIPHDSSRDSFCGSCPFHGDCLEGLASGHALRERWNAPAETLGTVPEVWMLEAEYLSYCIVNLIYTVSPHRIVLGGGVMHQYGLIQQVRESVLTALAGYIDVDAITRSIDEYVVPPKLGNLSGVIGAFELAKSVQD